MKLLFENFRKYLNEPNHFTDMEGNGFIVGPTGELSLVDEKAAYGHGVDVVSPPEPLGSQIKWYDEGNIHGFDKQYRGNLQVLGVKEINGVFHVKIDPNHGHDAPFLIKSSPAKEGFLSPDDIVAHVRLIFPGW